MEKVLSRLFSPFRTSGALMDYDDAKRRAADPDDRVRLKLARRQDVQPEILYFLAEDPAADVRREIAENNATPVQADLILARDDDEDVRCRLARKVARLAPSLTPEQKERVEDIVLEVLQVLAEDQIVRVRRILAEELQDTTEVPRSVIERLARDEEISVAGPVLENSPLLRDEFLLEIIESAPVQGALAAIARRDDLDAAVADRIAEADDVDAVTALLANPSAQVREETLDELVDRAEDVADWHAPLVVRPSLSQRAIGRLAEFVAENLLQKLQQRHDIDKKTAKRLSGLVRARLTDDAAEAGSVGETEPEDVAKELYETGKLDEKAVMGALDKGDRAFVIAALSLMSERANGIVQKIVSLASTKGLVSVAWKAGLSMRAAEQLQLRLARIAPSEILKARRGGFPLTEEEMEWQLEFFGG